MRVPYSQGEPHDFLARCTDFCYEQALASVKNHVTPAEGNWWQTKKKVVTMHISSKKSTKGSAKGQQCFLFQALLAYSADNAILDDFVS